MTSSLALEAPRSCLKTPRATSSNCFSPPTNLVLRFPSSRPSPRSPADKILGLSPGDPVETSGRGQPKNLCQSLVFPIFLVDSRLQTCYRQLSRSLEGATGG